MKAILLCLLLVCNLMAISAQDAAKILDAQTDVKKACQKARSENKMVLLIVVKDNCSWCEKMVHETLNDKNIRYELTDMVTVVVDISEKLPDGFKVTNTPAIFFIDAKKEKSVWENVGFVKKGTFLIDIISANERYEAE